LIYRALAQLFAFAADPLGYRLVRHVTILYRERIYFAASLDARSYLNMVQRRMAMASKATREHHRFLLAEFLDEWDSRRDSRQAGAKAEDGSWGRTAVVATADGRPLPADLGTGCGEPRSSDPRTSKPTESWKQKPT